LISIQTELTESELLNLILWTSSDFDIFPHPPKQLLPSIGVWQGVAIDSIEYHYGPPRPTLRRATPEMALLPYCLTALLPYCLTALLPYCLTALLPYCLTALLPYCLTTILPYCLTTLLPYCLVAFSGVACPQGRQPAAVFYYLDTPHRTPMLPPFHFATLLPAHRNVNEKN
jgi:hypothetical protein